jgi:dihydroneopterin aldolase
MDKVFIRELEIETIIGIYGWERKVRQRLLLSLEMKWDTAAVARENSIELALDYKSVADRLTEFVQVGEYGLLETAAEDIAQLLKSEFGVAWLQLILDKPDAIGPASGVGVIIERGERD